jgi:cytochrome c553
LRLIFFCLAWGVLPLSGQFAGVAVYTDFKQPPSSDVVASFEHEVDAIAAPIGLSMVWRPIDTTDRVVVGQRLVVAKFIGRCDSRGLPAPAFRSGQLGQTHTTDGLVLPFIDIDCDHIRGFVRTPLMHAPPAEREQMLGRAVGRVFAHELYHVLGQTIHHGSGAVDRSTYSVNELTAPALGSNDDCRMLQVEAATAAAPGSRRRGKLKFAQKLCNVCHGPSGEGTKRAPPLRSPSRMVDTTLLAVRLGIDGGAMCRRADQLKLTHPLLVNQDLEDLVRFLNAPPF